MKSVVLALFAALLLSTCLVKASHSKGNLKQQPFPYAPQESNNYLVDYLFEGPYRDWSSAGQWTIGGRKSQKVMILTAESQDQGQTLIGKMTLKDATACDFIAVKLPNPTNALNRYQVTSSYGDEGIWTLGGDNVRPVLAITFSGNQNAIVGLVTFKYMAPFAFRARRV